MTHHLPPSPRRTGALRAMLMEFLLITIGPAELRATAPPAPSTSDRVTELLGSWHVHRGSDGRAYLMTGYSAQHLSPAPAF